MQRVRHCAEQGEHDDLPRVVPRAVPGLVLLHLWPRGGRRLPLIREGSRAGRDPAGFGEHDSGALRVHEVHGGQVHGQVLRAAERGTEVKAILKGAFLETWQKICTLRRLRYLLYKIQSPF